MLKKKIYLKHVIRVIMFGLLFVLIGISLFIIEYQIFWWLLFLIQFALTGIYEYIYKYLEKRKEKAYSDLVIRKESGEAKKEVLVKQEEYNFENLIQKSHDLVNHGNQNYSKELFVEAITNWKEAIKIYNQALRTSLTHKLSKKIKVNQRSLRKSICLSYLENGNRKNIIALKAHEKKDLKSSKNNWDSAKIDFQKALNLIKSENLAISQSQIESKVNSIEFNLRQLAIEKTCLDAEHKFTKAQSIQKDDLREAIVLTQDSFLQYWQAIKQAKTDPKFQELINIIQGKLEKTKDFQSILQNRMADLINIYLLVPNIKIDESKYDKVGTKIEAEVEQKILGIKREYEFIGGQVRFKVKVINYSKYSLTGLKITFDIPIALKWILHEPDYVRKGDSISITKLGAKEKKTISLYLEPINCMESPINASISFFDFKDRPHAIPMKPKMISITCPLFFTETSVNLARVKSLRRKFAHRDRKVFPISSIEKSSPIFSAILSVLGKFDIKLISEDYSEADRFGEAWFYGITKVKKKRIVTYVILDSENRTLEFEVSGNDERQITAFLAEIGDKIRQHLVQQKIINPEDKFYDLRISVLSDLCPFCYSSLSPELVQEYNENQIIKCDNCNIEVNMNE